MKWLTVAGVLFYLARCSDAAVLKCTPESQDPLCASEKRDILPPPSPPATSNTCLAGSEWESNCHVCRCSDSGIAECEKQVFCEEQVLDEPIKCKPFTTFQKDCNTCTCLEDGEVRCSSKACRSSINIDRRKREVPTQGNPKCQPGSSWKESCNSCWCTDSGLSVCTKIGCLGNINNPRLKKRDTSKPNATLSRKTRAGQEAPKACQPGTEFRMDCNKCLCNDEGQDFSCTRIDCAAVNGNGGGDSFTGARSKRELSETVTMECVAGSVFDRECNVCRCTDGQHAVCTNKRCKHETTETETESTPSFRCTPGDQFKRDCNDCTCSADGKTYFCTLRLCDEELADIDVSQSVV